MLQAMLKEDHANTDRTVLKQNRYKRKIAKFFSKMNMIDWQFVLNETDTQSAYNKFNEVISTKYYACFPYRKTSKKYYKINLGYIQLWKNQSKLRINCMWNRREAMKMCPSKEIEKEIKSTDSNGRVETFPWYIVVTQVKFEKSLGKWSKQ